MGEEGGGWVGVDVVAVPECVLFSVDFCRHFPTGAVLMKEKSLGSIGTRFAIPGDTMML